MRRKLMASGGVAGWLLITPQVAEAYVGPAAGITAIGLVFALFGAIGLAFVGFVWYPIKRLRARIRERRSSKIDQKEVAHW